MYTRIEDNKDLQHISVKEAAFALNSFVSVLSDNTYLEHMIQEVYHNVYRQISDQDEAKALVKEELTTIGRCMKAIKTNNYTYLDAEVCDMVAETQSSLKSWTIDDLPIEPGTEGTILFEKPTFRNITAIDYSGHNTQDGTTDIVGILWVYSDKSPITGKNGTRHNNVLWASPIVNPHSGNSSSFGYGIADHEFAYEVLEDNTLIPLLNHKENSLHDKNIIDYFAATMMLMQQREIIAPPDSYRPTVKRGKRRDPVLIPTGLDNTREPMKISTVSLSETVRAAYAANNAGSGKKPNKSWWVKGHWRRQAYGPGRSLRKLIYIHPHISGNVNAPLDDRKTITKVVP